MFAPTWGRYGSLEQFGAKVVEQLLSLEANILFKMHDNTYLRLSYAVEEKQQKFEKFERVSNFRVIDDSDIYPYLQLTDLLIADYGSLIFEYLTLQKPAIFLDLSLHNRQVVSNFQKLQLLRKSCVTISSPNQLEEALKLVKINSNVFEENRLKLVREYVESAPHATLRVVDSLCNLLNLCNSSRREVS